MGRQVYRTRGQNMFYGREKSDIIPRVVKSRSSFIFIRYYERGEEEIKVVVVEGGRLENIRYCNGIGKGMMVA